MRAALLALVLANVLYFGWARWIAGDAARGLVATPEPPAASIELVQRPDLQSTADASAAPAATDADPVVPVTDEPVATVQVSDTGETVIEVPAPAAPDVVVVAAAPDSAAVSTTETPSESALSQPVETACLTAGPFNTRARATQAADTWRARGVAVEARSEPGKVWVGHWVHLPAAASLSAAQDVATKLRADGVRDLYVENAGASGHIVSLGLFSDITRAERRAGRMRQLDVRPQIRDRYRDGERVWLDLVAPVNIELDVTPYQIGPVTLTVAPRECPS